MLFGKICKMYIIFVYQDNKKAALLDNSHKRSLNIILSY